MFKASVGHIEKNCLRNKKTGFQAGSVKGCCKCGDPGTHVTRAGKTCLIVTQYCAVCVPTQGCVYTTNKLKLRYMFTRPMTPEPELDLHVWAVDALRMMGACPHGSCSSPFLLGPVSHLLGSFELLRQGLCPQATSLAPLVCFSETGSRVFKLAVQPGMILNSWFSCLHLELSAGIASGLYMLHGSRVTHQRTGLALVSKAFFLGGEIDTKAFTVLSPITACVCRVRSKTLALRLTFETGSHHIAQAGFKPSIFLAMS